MSFGLTYVLQAGDADLFKVGHTITPIENRMKQLQTGCPYRLKVYATIPSFFPDKREKVLRGMLRNCQTHGEWFALTPEEMDNFLSAPYFGANPWELEGDYRHGFRITPRSWASDKEGRPFLSARCICPSELEAEVLRLAQGLLQLLDAFPDYKPNGNLWRDHPFFKEKQV